MRRRNENTNTDGSVTDSVRDMVGEQQGQVVTMTLEEAILHCEKVASCCESAYEKNPVMNGYIERFYNNKECAEEHRQLAEWLKELKAFRETYPYGVRW